LLWRGAGDLCMVFDVVFLFFFFFFCLVPGQYLGEKRGGGGGGGGREIEFLTEVLLKPRREVRPR